jgi:hypothetical protein
MPLVRQSSGSPPRFMQTGLGPRFRLPSVDRRHPSSLGMGVPSSAPSYLPQRHYRELMKRGSRACSPSSRPRSWDRH